jgi:hypothetical protein
MRAVVKMALRAALLATALVVGNLRGADTPTHSQNGQLLGASGTDASPAAMPGDNHKDADESEFKFGVLNFKVGGPVWFRNTMGLVTLGLGIASLFWISKDAELRGKSSVTAVMFAIFAAWPVSLLWWLWLRPPMRPPPLPYDEVAS